MRGTRLIAVLTGIATVAIVAANAHAMYHPGLGRFVQRDSGPGAGSPARIGSVGPAVGGRFIPRDPIGSNQYADGMNLYQYVGSRPAVAVDPDGRVLVVLSGLLQSCNSGERLARTVGQAMADRMAQYDASGSADLGVVLLGMGGQGEENRLQKQWREFLDRRRKNPCSLEQFVAIGHSDGATAIFRTTNAGVFSRPDREPAYLALVDLVRLDYGLGTVNERTSADPRSHVTLLNKPKTSYVQNVWQENGAGWRGLWAGWKGRLITNANSNINASFVDSSRNRNHFTLWEFQGLHRFLAREATEYYEKAVKAEMAAGRGKWARKQGEKW